MSKEKKFIAEIVTWFDRRNGNSYFSARVYDMSMKLLFVSPFQYRYGPHPRDTVIGSIDALVLSVHMHNHDIAKLVYFNERKGTKKECQQNGIANPTGKL
jgi:exosome complex RNA-binding protein Rrp4